MSSRSDTLYITGQWAAEPSRKRKLKESKDLILGSLTYVHRYEVIWGILNFQKDISSENSISKILNNRYTDTWEQLEKENEMLRDTCCPTAICLANSGFGGDVSTPASFLK